MSKRSKPEIIAAGPMMRAEGKLPSRVVLREVKGGWHPWATHLEIHDKTGPTYEWGHYFADEGQAQADYEKRVKRGY